ncbi:MAG: ADP-ribosylglycohydrolase family protein [Spirochaetaceae bacterium]|jgi:ADP-ribosylglycohydrolase|nr:ADP-ribosylglycohydrolase family protein [Spirochaetaceae bacterium]
MSGERYILGAIAGDIIGSSYEFNNVKSPDFELFTDDTFFTDDSVLTMATMYAILRQTGGGADYAKAYRRFGRKYPHRGYGGNFNSWLYDDDPKPYNSWGNGSAMRASPVGWYCGSIDDVLAEAEKSAAVTHNHPEGIKGAQAAAAAVFLARTGKSKDAIKQFIVDAFGYDLDRTIDEIRPAYEFDVSCQGSAPEAIIAFLESSDYENAVRLAVSIGGDSDTIAAVTGGIAEAFYGKIPEDIAGFVRVILGPDLMQDVVIPFSKKYRKKGSGYGCKSP